jgi:hypothetical protein
MLKPAYTGLKVSTFWDIRLHVQLREFLTLKETYMYCRHSEWGNSLGALDTAE